MNKIEKIDKKTIYTNKNLPLSQRKKAFDEEVHEMMNPVPASEFDPVTFNPIKLDDVEDSVYYRDRKKHVGKFPTLDIEPKTIREGQMIGMYESKQDIYLIFAHKINDLMDVIEKLEKEVVALKKKVK